MKVDANIEHKHGDVHVDGDSMTPNQATELADRLLSVARAATQWRKEQRRIIQRATLAAKGK